MTQHFSDPIPLEVVRQRAYEIWEREGRPQGKSADHWLRAERELYGDCIPWPMIAQPRTGPPKTIYFWDYCG